MAANTPPTGRWTGLPPGRPVRRRLVYSHCTGAGPETQTGLVTCPNPYSKTKTWTHPNMTLTQLLPSVWTVSLHGCFWSLTERGQAWGRLTVLPWSPCERSPSRGERTSSLHWQSHWPLPGMTPPCFCSQTTCSNRPHFTASWVPPRAPGTGPQPQGYGLTASGTGAARATRKSWAGPRAWCVGWVSSSGGPWNKWA